MRQRQQGFIYVISLGVLLMMTMLSASMLIRSLVATGVAERSERQAAAFQLAEAAVDQEAVNLRTAAANDDVLFGVLPLGTFSVVSVAPIDAQTQRVTGRGIVGSEQRDVEAIVRTVPQSIFQFALFADQRLSVGGSANTDSYDSRNGAYDASTNHGHDGDVGTNAATAGGVTVSGSIFVDGQIAVGAGVSNPTSVVTGYNPAFITGGTSPPSDTQDVISQAAPFPMEPVAVPPGLTCNDTTVNGNSTTTLSPTGGPLGNGTYCYHNLTIQGGAILTATGKVKVYLTGDLIARGNSTVGVPSDPTKMIFLMNSTNGATLEEGTVTGSTEFYGALYGPIATINITGNAKVFGSIIAKTITESGSAEIHFDEALAANTDVSNLYKTTVVSWRDLN